ncbi:MAG: alpha/beta hydrolase [Gammaproteobacteria bacterium]|nr:alpha/beta hydrolase [Gammaproteobacteria bacterium]
MATFVLVHGAWRGSWLWKRVRPALQARGHDVHTPTLTGVGERSHLASPQVNLETQILDVVNLLRWEELSDVVLCGHSYAGCVVTGVADRMPERIRALVYLDSFVPANGERLIDHLPAEQIEHMREGAKARGQGFNVPPIPAAAFQGNVADRDWVDRQCTFHPLACFEQPIELTGGIDSVRNVTYVRATGYGGASPFDPFYATAQAKGWQTLTIDCGHDVMLDRPEELTETLLQVAQP